MRNLLINLTFVLTLIIGHSIDGFSQIQNPLVLNGTTNQLVTVTVVISNDGGVFEGSTTIAQPITKHVTSRDVGMGVAVKIMKGGSVVYTNDSSYTDGWALNISDSIVTALGSGDFELIVTVNNVSVITDEFTLE